MMTVPETERTRGPAARIQFPLIVLALLVVLVVDAVVVVAGAWCDLCAQPLVLDRRCTAALGATPPSLHRHGRCTAPGSPSGGGSSRLAGGGVLRRLAAPTAV